MSQKSVTTDITSKNNARRAPAYKRINTFSVRPGNLSPIEFTGKESQKLKQIVSKLLKGEIPHNWEEELQHINECTLTGAQRYNALRLLFSKWAEADFDKAFHAVVKIGAYDIEREIISQFAENSPKEALQYFVHNKGNLDFLVERAAPSWARRNPDEALAWCLSTQENTSSLRLKSIMGVAIALILAEEGFHSPKTIDYLDKIYAAHGSIPPKTFSFWAAEDPDAAQEWIERIGKDSLKYKKELITGAAFNDLPRAIKIFSELSEKEQSMYLNSIHSIIRDEETSFSFLIQAKPLSELKERDFSYSMVTWASQSPDEAGEWIRRLPSSEAKDIAVEFYVEGLASGTMRKVDYITGNLCYERPYKEALQMVNGMKNAERRERAMAHLSKCMQKEN